MELTTKQIEDFKRLYQDKFNIELSNQEAGVNGMKFITLMKEIILPTNCNKNDEG